MNTKEWLIPDMFWPAASAPGIYESNEAICVLNPGNEVCSVYITLYYEDREPVELPVQYCGARRTTHIRMDRILTAEREPIARGVGYAALIRCSVPAMRMS